MFCLKLGRVSNLVEGIGSSFICYNGRSFLKRTVGQSVNKNLGRYLSGSKSSFLRP
jgi:hypothetical protein